MARQTVHLDCLLGAVLRNHSTLTNGYEALYGADVLKIWLIDDHVHSTFTSVRVRGE